MRIKKPLLILLVIVIAALSVTIAAACNDGPDAVNVKPPAVTNEHGENLSDGEVHELPGHLIFTEATTSSEPSSVTLTATVLPESATNKLVDWSIEWLNPNSEFAAGKDVTDYVTVTPLAAGSNTATVTCLLPFDNETIIITVTTRDGGFQATCTVIFRGIATQFTVDTSQLTSVVEGGFTIYEVGSNSTITLPLNLSNSFDSVLATDLSVSVQGQGSFEIRDHYRTTPGTWFISNVRAVSLEEQNAVWNLLSCEIVDGNLQITTNMCIEDIPGVHYSGDAAKAVWGEYAIYGDQGEYHGPSSGHAVLCFYIFVKDNVSGLSVQFRAKIVPSVQSVYLSESTIAF